MLNRKIISSKRALTVHRETATQCMGNDQNSPISQRDSNDAIWERCRISYFCCCLQGAVRNDIGNKVSNDDTARSIMDRCKPARPVINLGCAFYILSRSYIVHTFHQCSPFVNIQQQTSQLKNYNQRNLCSLLCLKTVRVNQL